jgi:DNA-binding transcriptional ArsR family regulator
MPVPRRNGSGIALLADPTRLRLIALVAIRPRRSSALASELGISRPAASRHLKLLSEAGLIEAHRSPIDGRWRTYVIAPSRHGVITAWLAGTEVGMSEDGRHPISNARGEPSPNP